MTALSIGRAKVPILALILACGGISGLFTGIAEARTAAELVTEARELARDPSATGRTRFTDAQILKFINRGMRDTISYTQCLRDNYTFELVALTTWYDLPSNFISVIRVKLKAEDYLVLEEKSLAGLDRETEGWETVQGQPDEYYVSFSSRTKISFYPIPATHTDTGTIHIDYYTQADILTVSDTPFNAVTEFTPFHSMLSFYAAAEMTVIDGLFGLSDRYMARYITDRERFKLSCIQRPGYRPSISPGPR